MKNLKKITALMLCAVLVFTLFACGKKETASGEAEPVKWDFCVINSLTHPSSVLCQQFADEVYEKTDGMVQITVRAPGELSYSANDYLTAVGDGSHTGIGRRLQLLRSIGCRRHVGASLLGR